MSERRRGGEDQPFAAAAGMLGCALRKSSWSGLLLGALLLGAPSAAAPATADVVHLDAGEVRAPATALATAAATLERTEEGVAVVRFEGDYDRGQPFNVAARQAVAQSFYSAHGDDYDFLIAFTTFDFDLGGARAFYAEIKNDTVGIGRPLLDHSASFGSGTAQAPGRLQGYVDMGSLASWRFEVGDPGYEELLSTVMHELMHRWCCYVDLEHPTSALDALRGVDGGHWSDLLSSGASVMYGHQWQDLGGGNFRSLAIRKFFGPLDLYLAGLLRPEQVPPLLLIDNPALDPAVYPEERDEVTGVAQLVSVDQVIAAAGPRQPAAGEAPKQLRAAFLVVAREGDEVASAELATLRRLAREVAVRFAILTGAEASLEVVALDPAGSSGSPPDGPDGGPPRTGPVDTQAALAWLRAQQAADGSFRDTAGTPVRDTTTALGVLAELDPAFAGAPLATAWLRARSEEATDPAARIARALGVTATNDNSRLAALLLRQGADGGWGAGPGWASTPLDTALAVRALARSGSAPAIDRAVTYLLSSERAGGGWSSVAGGPGRTAATALVLEALADVGRSGEAAAARAVTFLAGRQNLDGGFGDSPSSSHDTAQVLLTLGRLEAAGAVDRVAAESYLGARQTVAGSWDGSVYATALAVAALRTGSLPNLSFATTPTVVPASPRDGERTTVQVVVENRGGSSAAASDLALWDGAPDAGGTRVALVSLPSLAAGARQGLALDWPTRDRAGSRQLVLVIDPAAAVEESIETDNQALVEVVVQPVPAGVELEATALAVLPAEPSSLPIDLSLVGQIANFGATDAGGVLVRLRRDDGVVVQEGLVDLPARSAMPWPAVDRLTVPGTTRYTLLLDPQGAIVEADEGNNQATAEVTTRPRLDLEVTPADLTVPPAVYVGGDVLLGVVVRNRGTVDLERNVGLQVTVAGPAGSEVLVTPPVFLAAGQERRYELPWRPVAVGEHQLRVEIDLAGTPLVLDADLANNAAETTFAVAVSPIPNLVVRSSEVVVVPDPGLEGAPLRLEIPIESQVAASGAFTVRAYDGAPALGRVLGEQRVAAMAAGERRVVTVELPVPADDHDLELVVVVDVAAEQAETNESDNVALRSLVVWSLPDAAISTAALSLTPEVPAPGDAVILTARVTNLGEQPLLDLDVALEVAGSVVASARVARIAGGETLAVPLGFTPPDGDSLSAVVRLDATNAIRERSELNNQASLELTVQDSDAVASPRYLSPNGDEVQDTTRFVGRLTTAAAASVEVLGRDDEVVRRFAGLTGPRVEVTWDGRDEDGRVVRDGVYRLRALGAAGERTGEASVTVDTNHWPLLPAILAGLSIERSLTCGLPTFDGEPVVSDDEQWMVFAMQGGGYPNGLYRMPLDGSPPQVLATLSASQTIEHFAVSPDGSQVVFQVSGVGAPRAMLWSTDGSLREVPGLYGQYVQFDPSGTTFVGFDGSVLRRWVVAGLTSAVVATVDLTWYQGAESILPSPDRRAWLLSEQVVLDLETGVSVPVDSGGVQVWSWNGESFLVVPRDTEVDEGGGGAIPCHCAEVRRRDGSLLRRIDLPRDPMPPGLFASDERSFDEAAAAEPRLVAATFDEFGERVAMTLEFTDGDEVFGGWVGRRFVVADSSVGSVKTVGWGTPRYLCGEGGHRCDASATAAPTLFGVDNTLLWVPYNEDLLVDSVDPGRIVGQDGAQFEIFPASTRSLGKFRTVPSGHFLLASQTSLRALERGVWLEDLSGDAGSRLLFRIEVPVGAGTLVFESSSGFGYEDVDLFVRRGELPTAESFDCSSETAETADEICTLPSPAPGTWYVLLQARTAFAGVDLIARHSGPAVSPPSCVGDRDDVVVHNLANLTADLRARRAPDGRSILLEGSATDANFAHYQLDYRRRDSGPDWLPIGPPSGEPVLDGPFQPWVAPGAADYLVRLAVVDKAGNRREVTRPISTDLDPEGVVDVYLSERAISPNGDGRFDRTELHYRTVSSYTADFVVRNPSGAVVYTARRVHAQPEPGSFTWDGRNDFGQLVPDGRYIVSLAAFELEVRVDTTPPPIVGLSAEPFSIVNLEPVLDPFLVGISGPLSRETTDIRFEVGLGEVPARWNRAYDVSFIEFDPFWGGLFKTLRVPLGPADYTGRRYRLVGEDELGNRNVLTGPPAVEKLYLFEINGPIDPLVLPRLIAEDYENGYVRLATGSDGRMTVLLHETVGPALERLEVQMLEPGAEWVALPLGRFFDGAGLERSTPPDGQFTVVFSPRDLPGSPQRVFRLRGTDATGRSFYTSRFGIAADGAAAVGLVGRLTSLDDLGPGAGDGGDLEQRRAALAALLATHGLDPARRQLLWSWEELPGEPERTRLLVSSHDDPAFVVPVVLAPVAAGGGVAIFETNMTCGGYWFGLAVQHAGRNYGAGWKSPDDPYLFEELCAGPNAELVVDQADACGEPAPERLTVRFHPVGDDMDVLRLVDATGRVLFSQVQPVEGQSYEHEIDLGAMPEEGVRLEAQVVLRGGFLRRQLVPILPDRTPPLVDILRPVAGQRVCRERPDLRIFEEMQAAPELQRDLSRFAFSSRTLAEELAREPRGDRWLVGDHAELPPLSYDVAIGAGSDPSSWVPLRVVSEVVDPGAVVDLVHGDTGFRTEPGVDLPAAEGIYTLRVRVAGAAGLSTCRTTTFTLDGSVGPITLTSEQLPRALAFSPNGDGVQDVADLTATPPGEPVAASLRVAECVDPRSGAVGGPGCSQPGALVRTLADYAALSTPVAVRWDGTGSSGVVPEGRYLVTAKGADGCANEQTSTAVVILDVTPPQLAIARPFAGAGLPVAAEIRLVVSDAGDDLEGGGLTRTELHYGEGTSPSTWWPIGAACQGSSCRTQRWNTWGLPAGDYTLRAVARDRAGNRTEVQLPVVLPSRPGVIRYLEPVPDLFSPNGDGRRDVTVARFALAVAASVDLEVLDAAGQLVRSVVAHLALSDGAHTLAWDGHDDLGQRAADGEYLLRLRAEAEISGVTVVQTEAVTVRLDATPPAVGVTAPPAEGFLRSAGGMRGSVVDPLPVLWMLQVAPEGGAWQEVASGSSPAIEQALAPGGQALAEGRWRLRLAAEDEAGNRAEQTVAFTLDDTPPEVALRSPEPGVVVGAPASPLALLGAVADAHLAEWTLDAVAPSTGGVAGAATRLATGTAAGEVTTSWAVGELANGTWTLTLVAVDRAGNRGTATRTVVVDTVAPSVAITTPEAAGYVKAATSVLGSVGDLHLRSYELELVAGGAVRPLGIGVAAVDQGLLGRLDPLPADGPAVLRVRAVDAAGNQTVHEVAFVIDTTPPAAPTGLVATLEGSDGVLTWNPNVEPDLVGYHVLRDGVRLTSTPLPTPGFRDPNLAPGTYHYTVLAVDRAGWESPPSAPARLIYDRTPPTVALSRPLDAARVSGVVDVIGSAWSEDFAELRLFATRLDSGSTLQLRRSPVPARNELLASWASTLWPDETRVRLRLEGEDTNGNVASVEREVTIDNTAPAAPLALTATVTATSEVTTTWSAVADGALAGYLLYRNGRLANATGPVIGDLSPYLLTTTTWVDRNLADGRFTYVVYAVDRAGNQSLPSNEAVATIETGPPSLSWVRPDAGTRFGGVLDLAVVSEDEDVASVRFELRRVGVVAWTALAVDVAAPFGAVLDPSVLGLTFGDYELRATATDSGGRVGPSTPLRRVTYADTQAPAVVELVTARADGGDVVVGWQANSTDPDPAAVRYHVERQDGAQWVRLTASPLAGNSYTDTGLADGDFTYAVVAVDPAGNEAGRSSPATSPVRTPVLAQPFSPTRDTQVALTGVGYPHGEAEVTVSGPVPLALQVPTDAEGRFTQALDLGRGTSLVRVRVNVPAGHRSRLAELQVVSATAPTVPQNLVDSGTGFDVALAWDANPETDLAGYHLYRNGALELADTELAPVVSNRWADGSTYEVPEAADGDPGTVGELGTTVVVDLGAAHLVSRLAWHWYAWDVGAGVVASPARLRVEAAHGPGWVTLADLDVVGTSTELALPEPYPAALLRLRLTHRTTAEGEAVTILVEELEVHAATLVPVVPPSYATTVVDGRYRFAVSAVNVFGFASPRSPETPERAVGDVVPPAPVVLDGIVVGANAELTWAASTETGVSYELARDGVAIANLLDLSYVDRELANATYRYTVRVIDAAGNRSAWSNEVALTVAVPAPLPPTLVSVVAGDPGELRLHWQPAAEGTPAESFGLWRGEQPGGPYQEVGRIWPDLGLPPEACCDGYDTVGDQLAVVYVVVAYSTSGLVSPPSNELGIDLAALVDRPVITFPTPAARSWTTPQVATPVAGLVPGAAWQWGGIPVSLARNGVEIASVEPATSASTETLAFSCPWTTELPWPSTDGRFLWVDCGSAHALLDFQAGTVETPAGIGVGTARFAPYATAVVFTAADGTVQRYDVASREVRDLGLAGVALAVPAADPELLVWLGEVAGQLGVWLRQGDQAPSLVRELGAALGEIALDTVELSPDARHLVWRRGSRVELLSLLTGGVVELTAAADSAAPPPQFSWDGASVLVSESVGDPAGGLVAVWRHALADGTRTPVVGESDGLQGFVEGPQGFAGAALSAGEGVTARLLEPRSGTQQYLHTSWSGSRLTRWRWSPSGHLFVVDGAAVRITPPGRFELASVELPTAETILEASHDGQRSLPVTVRRPFASTVGDLVVSLRLLPELPVAGSAAGLVAEVRNVGLVAIGASELGLAVAGQGLALAPEAGLPVPALAPGGTATLLWPLTLPVAGEYQASARVDVRDQWDEAREDNNGASLPVRVLAASGLPTLQLGTDAPRYGLGATVAIDAQVARNGGPLWQGRLELAVEDALGIPVQTLPAVAIVDLAAGEERSLPASWSTAETFAGFYRVRARLVSAAGDVVAEATSPFEISPVVDGSASLRAAPAAVAPGATVRLTADLRYDRGNVELHGSDLVLELRDAGDVVVATLGSELGSWLPGSSGASEFTWSFAVPGSYRAVLVWRLGAVVIAEAEAELLVVPAPLALGGSLALPPPLPLAVGQTLVPQWQVRQSSGAALASLPLRLALRRTDAATLLVTATDTAVLTAGAAAGAENLATVGLAPGSHVVELAVELGGSWLLLAQQPVELVDRTPPTVAVVAPAPGALVGPAAQVEVVAVDASGSLDAVDVRFDDGSWQSATQSGAGRYRRSLAGLVDGPHEVTGRAVDTSAQLATSDLVAFFFDGTPPTIEISGVVAGEVAAPGVAPEITISDAHPGLELIALDGAPYAPGTPIVTTGPHVLTVVAVDAVGNAASRRLEFAVAEVDASRGVTLGVTLIGDLDGNGLAGPGERLGYELRATNQGSQAATGLVLDLVAPAGASVDPASVVVSAGQVSYPQVTLDTLPPGGTWTVTFAAVLDDPFPLERTEVALQLAVDAAQWEPTPSRDTAGAVDGVTRMPVYVPVRVSLVDLSVAEAIGAAAVSIELDRASNRPVSLPLAARDIAGPGAAVSGVDYLAPSQLVEVPAGTTVASFPLTVLADAVYEEAETFEVALAGDLAAWVGAARGVAVVTVLDDDPAPTLAIQDAAITEAGATLTFAVELGGATALPARVQYTTRPGSAGAADFDATAGELVLAPGTSRGEVAVTLRDDQLDEPDETFELALSAPGGATLARDLAVGTIRDDDDPPTVAALPVTVFEGEGESTLSVPIELASPSGFVVEFTAATVDGSATADLDYRADSARLTLAAGETAATLSVTVLGDDLVEGNETFTVVLRDVVHATAATAEVVVTLIDDDTAAADLDFGDAGNGYPTLLAADGARHVVLGTDNPTLGASVDSELEGAPTSAADGDDGIGSDDEDGVIVPASFVPGTPGELRLAIGATGGLAAAWIDWNRDGDWSDAGEQVAADAAVSASAAVTLPFAVPATAVAGPTVVRVRISSQLGLAATGLAADGEVEDHLATIAPETPLVGVALRLAAVNQLPSGASRVDFAIRLVNHGTVPLAALRLVDDLAAAFPGATVTVEALTSADLIVNPQFDGRTDHALLVPGQGLAVGADAAVELRLLVHPGALATVAATSASGPLAPGQAVVAPGSAAAGGSPTDQLGGPQRLVAAPRLASGGVAYAHQVQVFAESPRGTLVSDLSDDGSEPDGDGDGDPTNDNDPTTVVLADPAVAIPVLDGLGALLLAAGLLLAAMVALRRRARGAGPAGGGAA